MHPHIAAISRAALTMPAGLMQGCSAALVRGTGRVRRAFGSTAAPFTTAATAVGSSVTTHPLVSLPATPITAASTVAPLDQSRKAAADQPSALGRLVVYYADHHVVPLPDKHRFPMLKYAAVHRNLETDASLAHCLELRPGPLVELKDLLPVHDAAYIQRFTNGQLTPDEMRNVGFPWSPELVGRNYSSTGGTVAATRLVLSQGKGMAANAAGGTHHAFRDKGEAFCVFNDIAVAASVAMREHALTSILVLDLDVHQGNGTAAIFEDDPRVTTFDMHGDKNYPWRTRMRNTYDVALPDGTGDAEYLEQLQDWLPRLISHHQPQLIFLQAGVDPMQGDSFGRLALTRDGLNRRNNLVYSTALREGIPLVITMGGGYTRPPDASIQAHTDVYRTAAYRLHAHMSAAATSDT